MKCNLIVPGFAKSGTSSLHSYLDLHPEIAMSSNKEPHYFSRSDRWELGPDWHDALFSSAGSDTKVYGESSTSYAVWEPALRRIKDSIPDAKLIFLLREPVERLLSHYRWMYALGYESRLLADALEAEDDATQSPDVHIKGCYPWYRRHSDYSRFCPLAVEIFGAENILFLRSSDLRKDPQATLNRCFEFLGLGKVNVENSIETNQTSSIAHTRDFGLKRLWVAVPKPIRQGLNKGRVLTTTVKSILGKKRLVAPQVTDAELRAIKEMLADSCAYYESLECCKR